MQLTNVGHNTLFKRVQGNEFQKVEAGNAEFDGKLFQFMGLSSLDYPEESVFETRMIAVQNRSDAILLHQRSQVLRTHRDHSFSRLKIVDRAGVDVVRALNPPQSGFCQTTLSRGGCNEERCDHHCNDEKFHCAESFGNVFNEQRKC